MRALVVASVMFFPTFAWAGETQEVDEVTPEYIPDIYGGTVTPQCGWPTTVSLNGCTGTLVHPRLVVYAAHCGGNIPAVYLGESLYDPVRTVGTEFCRTNPAYGGGSSGRDQAFCVLSTPQNDVPIVPPLMGCETGVLTPGREVTIVGFGNADANPSYGIKRNVTTTINSVQNDEAFIGGNGLDSCQGDSGGPVYVRLSSEIGGDDTWRVFGITSYGGACGGGGYYSMMHTQMSWFEQESGIDLTPCFSSNGEWQPGPECGFFPNDSEQSNGGWNNGCNGGGTGVWSSICGPAFNSEPDETPPTVGFVTPEDGAILDTGGAGTIKTDVVVEADDGDGWGVKSVELYIDGSLIDTDTTAPYDWSLTFPQGVFELTAVATDIADNVSQPAVIKIGVDAEPPAGSGGDSGGGEDSGDGEDAGGDDGSNEGGLDGGTGGLSGGGADGSDEGCSCDAGPRGREGAPLAALLLIGLAGLRRRRR